MTLQGNVLPGEAAEAYGTSAIEGATPGRLVLQTYDHIIKCCRKKDVGRGKKGLVELQSALNLDYLEISGPLYRIYEYCTDRLRDEKFAEVAQVMTDLRSSWSKIVRISERGGGGNSEG